MLRFRSIAALMLALLLAPLASNAQPGGRGRPDIDQVNRLIVEQTNTFRRANGLEATAPNPALAQAARSFAAYMARTDRYGHEADGREPAQRATEHGYAYCLVAENIAYQFHSHGFRALELAKQLVEGWKDSPGHRRNMLDADATETGAAVVQSARSGRYYAVQMFGRPQAMRIAFRIANRSATPVRYELGGQSYQLPPRVTRTHEQCRAETLTLHLPGSADKTTLRPMGGERYAVEQVGTRIRVTKG